MWLRKYRTAVYAFLLILLSLAIISWHRRVPGRVGLFDQAIYGMARPLQWTISKGFFGMRSLWERYIWLVGVERENRLLRERLQALEQRLADYQELKAFNERLRKLIDFQTSAKHRTMAAQVIGEDSTGWLHTMLIDKGRRHGLKKGMAVVTSGGVVGQTYQCADGTCKVLLIIDRNSAVDVMIQRTRTRGILEGNGKRNTSSLKYVARTANVLVGDRVVTSGLGGIFPKGLLVGNVASTMSGGYGLFQTVEVEPKVDFDRLEEVLVLLDETDRSGR